MNELTRGQLLKELAARGYRNDGSSPNRSIVLDYDELADIEIGELLEQMVERREKILRAIDSVGKDTAMQHYEDAQRAIEAMKTVIKQATD